MTESEVLRETQSNFPDNTREISKELAYNITHLVAGDITDDGKYTVLEVERLDDSRWMANWRAILAEREVANSMWAYAYQTTLTENGEDDPHGVYGEFGPKHLMHKVKPVVKTVIRYELA
jgi:hypothetical protein